MNTAFRKSFSKDLKKIHEQNVLDRVRKAIEEVEAAVDLSEVGNVKKMTGTDNFYRIRVGDFRIGISVEADTITFIRCLHRRNLYRFFP